MFRLILVPYELGRLREGVGRGPEHLLASGAADALASSGRRVDVELVELERPYGRTGEGDVDACFALIGAVAGRVRAAVDEGAMPIVLSGSCFAAVGVVAGLGERDPAVVWMDAHSDFNHPDTSLEGYFDGMGLAVLTGGAWQGMAATVGVRPVDESAVILAGARDLEPPEVVRLAASRIRRVAAEQMRTPAALLEALRERSPEPSGLYLHVDLDVLDIEAAHVNVYGAPGGVTGDELTRLVGAVRQSAPVRAVSLTAYDPSFDNADRVPPIALDVLRALA